MPSSTFKVLPLQHELMLDDDFSLLVGGVGILMLCEVVPREGSFKIFLLTVF
jgi:hypothetical protein